jgi:hypothetical protein
MNSRQSADTKASSILLDLIERRFDVRVPTSSVPHLLTVREHYMAKRKMLLWEHGTSEVLDRDDYAKAVMISEAASMMLREIDPWPRRKKHKGRKHA